MRERCTYAVSFRDVVSIGERRCFISVRLSRSLGERSVRVAMRFELLQAFVVVESVSLVGKVVSLSIAYGTAPLILDVAICKRKAWLLEKMEE